MRRDLNKWMVILIIAAIVVAAVLFVIIPNLPQSTTNVRLGDGIFRAQVAKTDYSREKGLSDITSLTPDQALLMVFPVADKWPIWMKDMKVPIDIIWLDSNKKVVYIVKNAEPPGDSTPQTFTPRTSAKYVIELPAGTVDSRAILSDSLASFQFDESGVK
ncbi:MAG: DUF192 domain-containing protein [Candidatus Saccharimonadales bacterium]